MDCTSRTYLELIGLVDDVEIGLDSKSFFQTLLEQALESHNLLDIAKEGVDLGRRQERFLLQRLQVVLQQVVQMLQPKQKQRHHQIGWARKRITKTHLDISPFRLYQLQDAFLELLAVRKLPIGCEGYGLRRSDTSGR